jgi:hypothetical protein
MGKSMHGGVVLDEAPGVTLRSIPAAGGGGGRGSYHWTGGRGGDSGRGRNSKRIILADVSSIRVVVSVER